MQKTSISLESEAYLAKKIENSQRLLSQQRLFCFHSVVTIVALGNISPPPEYRQSGVEPDRTMDQGVNLGILRRMNVALPRLCSHHLSHFTEGTSVRVRMPWNCSYSSLEGENLSGPPCKHC
jgi:hypothetical protein